MTGNHKQIWTYEQLVRALGACVRHEENHGADVELTWTSDGKSVAVAVFDRDGDRIYGYEDEKHSHSIMRHLSERNIRQLKQTGIAVYKVSVLEEVVGEGEDDDLAADMIESTTILTPFTRFGGGGGFDGSGATGTFGDAPSNPELEASPVEVEGESPADVGVDDSSDSDSSSGDSDDSDSDE